jgi:hypothetical protein
VAVVERNPQHLREALAAQEQVMVLLAQQQPLVRLVLALVVVAVETTVAQEFEATAATASKV